ncbi:GNAT family N-acetyltransferase [Arthrobacter sp. CAN_A1]|uniref:GNAT family N-acetyltransferase n=1 Tax=Arthrobacter sp. CAN_A1 TaxID=2787717 RepID=UPI0018CA0018
MTTSAMTIDLLPRPATLDLPDGADFIAAADLSNLMERVLWGNDDHFYSPQARYEASQPNDYEERVMFVARDAGSVVGKAVIDIPLTDNLNTCYVFVLVHPDYRGKGLGSRLYSVLADHAASVGRSTIMSWTDLPAGFDMAPANVLVPATGAGAFPRNCATTALALRNGFQLAQVDRCSVLELSTSLPRAAAQAQAAHEVAGEDYELVQWRDRCPDDLVDQYALLRKTMSADVPMGDLEWEEEVWDAARIREGEERLLRSGGHSLVRAARHLPTGLLAGHTILEYQPVKPEVVSQDDTLVLRSHRGKRLGMWLKTANLREVPSVWPEARRVYTWNAEENQHMLAVNVEMGFVPAGYTAAWQKKG